MLWTVEVASDGVPLPADDSSLVVTVYVLDGNDHVRDALVELVDGSTRMAVVGSSGDAAAAVAEIVALRPRVAVVDGDLGDMVGLHVCQQIQLSAPDVGCVIVTAGIGLAWGPFEAGQAGAAAFVLKQVRDFPLLEVIARVAAGERLLGPLHSVSAAAGGEGQLGGANR